MDCLWRGGTGGLATGIVQQNIGGGKHILWWLGQSIVLIDGFVLTLNFLPQLGFMFLLLPLFPPLMEILSLIAGLLNRESVYPQFRRYRKGRLCFIL